MKHLRTLVDIFAFPIIVFLVHTIAMVGLNVYAYWPDFDVPMHMLGGASVAVAYYRGIQLLQKKKFVPKLRPMAFGVFLLSLVVTTAVLWEWWEFFMDWLFPQWMMQLNLSDTMGDLLNGAIGGLIVILVIFRKKK